MKKALGTLLALLLFTAAAGGAVSITVKAADPEKVMQLKTKGIEDPSGTGAAWAGDYVTYSDCYFYDKYWNGTVPALAPPVTYRVTDAYRYDRTIRKRVMDLQSTADNSVRQIILPEVAFISAASGGKISDFDNGDEMRKVPEAEVNNWKLTIKNPYDGETNPTGMRMPEISNVHKDGNGLCFDYEDLYSTGNCYLSAIVLTKYEREIVAYDRIVDASYRGNGTAVIHWPQEYDENGYVLKVFAEQYNGDNMTDYISDIQYVYQGFDPDED